MPVANPINSTRVFVFLASSAIVLGLLFWLRPILIPVALAILLTFLSSRPVELLQRRGLPRVPAVLIVTIAIFTVIVGIGWLVARQANSLVETFPQYEHNLSQKIAALKAGEWGFIDKLQTIVARITYQVQKKTPSGGEAEQADPLPVKVISEDEGPFNLSSIWSALGPALAPFAAVGLAAVLVIFMLIKLEDLRDRIISLVGHGRLTVTTKALDEAGGRISRYLFMQLIVNGSYGIAVGIGLYLIGVPYALLWGFFAAVFRYIPYIGPWIAALLPISLSLLVSESWVMPLLVVGLFLTLESVSNMVIEPWLYGRGVGVSPAATLLMIAFWTWLWGPIGLILATPLTVCLVVLGKYVPPLKFFDTLLGDQPALEAHVGYYQRLLARDQDEALDIAEEHLKNNSLEQTYDTLVLPALLYAERDRANAGLNEVDQRFVLDATLEIVEELSALQKQTAVESNDVAPEAPAAKASILGCPASDDTDEVALVMLKKLLDPKRYEVTLTTKALLASELVELVEDKKPALVCIGAPPPRGQTHARLLCLRLRARFPDLKIVVGRWGLDQDVDKKREQLLAAGADEFATTLQESRRQIEALAPLAALHEGGVYRSASVGRARTA